MRAEKAQEAAIAHKADRYSDSFLRWLMAVTVVKVAQRL